MELNNYNISARWRWQWEDMCGPGGLKIWTPERHDLGVCFQELCLQIPVLVVLAIISAYYFGSQVLFVKRGPTQMIAVNLRCAVVAFMAFFPMLHVYMILNNSTANKDTIFYFLSAIECLTWLMHLGYTLALRRRLGLSARGPVLICFVWTIAAVFSAVSLRTHTLIYRTNTTPDGGVGINFAFSVCTFILHIFYGFTLIPNIGNTGYEHNHGYTVIGENQTLLPGNAYHRFLEERDPNYLGVAMEESTWLSKLLFYWVNPLMQKGVERKLVYPDDLYDLPDSLRSDTLSRKLERALIGNVDDVLKKISQRNNELGSASQSSGYASAVPDVSIIKPHNVSLLRALHKCFWLQFYSIGILKLTADCAGFAGPMLLNKLVGFIENKSEDIQLGYGYAAGLFSVTLIAAFCNSHFNFLMSLVGLKIRASLVTTIYKKTLSVGGTVLSSAFSVGEIVNFMSTDTDRVVNSCPSFHALWSIPFQIAVTLYLLYLQVGLAFLAGVGFTIILIPINKLIANKIGELSTKMMEQKDKRVKIMTEILKGIRSIKLHVWEAHFIKLVANYRDSELKYLKGRKYLDALCVYFWATTPVLIAILTIVTYVSLGNKLTAATVFTSIALLNMLIGPLNAFPWVLNGMTEAWVSIKRIQRLLDLPDLDFDEYYDQNVTEEYPNSDIIIKNGEFSWGRTLSPAEREKLHRRRKPVKDKGIGKKSKRSLERFNDSPDFSEERLMREFYLTGINLNIRKGEFVGIIGIVGSGKSSIFSAVLAELTKQNGHIAVSDLDSGFALVTQQPWLQRGTIRDNILFGKTFDEIKYNEVIAACCLVEDLGFLPAGDLTGVGEGGMTLSGGQKARIAIARAAYQDKQIYLFDDIISAVDANVAKFIFQNCIMGLLRSKTKILCTHHVRYLTHADRIVLMENGTIKQQGKPSEVLLNLDDFLPIDLELGGESLQSSLSYSTKVEETSESDSLLNEETSETGTVEFSVYGSYWKAIGHLLSVSILISIVLMQTSRNMTDWWLSYWVTSQTPNNVTNFRAQSSNDRLVLYATNVLYQDSSMTSYMSIYVAFACVNSVFTLFRAFLFAYGGISAASKIHKMLLKSIMMAKVTFFDISPLGRILNRFSSDTYTVDDSLPFILNILLAQIFGLIGSVIITVYGLPWLCLVLVPLIPVYHWLQNHYRFTSRELKRLSSVTLSPIYSHFNETLQGLVVIRAFRTNSRFKRDNEDYVEVNQKTQLASQAAAQWLGLRLQFIGVAMVTGVVLIAVIQHQLDVADPGLVGLAISYALSITGLLSGVVNAFTETEREMIAVERVNQYIEGVMPENNKFIIDPPYGWPSQGVINFSNVVLRYREHLAASLKDISFETRPAEKIGVVGRTGAGKSSLFASIFRMCEISSGTISIDSVNINHISITALRSRLSCIPQDPFLFSGTVRENLDPLGEFRDTEIWSALTRVDLGPTITRLGGLDYNISSGGANFSVGQKQLICLARAILHNAKVLCIDEATANIDHETDRKIQCALRSVFRNSTVITIAHRVQTVVDCDRVIVMGDGAILEFGNPEVLLDDPLSYFYQLVNNN